jgi:hypothetical protein
MLSLYATPGYLSESNPVSCRQDAGFLPDLAKWGCTRLLEVNVTKSTVAAGPRVPVEEKNMLGGGDGWISRKWKEIDQVRVKFAPQQQESHGKDNVDESAGTTRARI